MTGGVEHAVNLSIKCILADLFDSVCRRKRARKPILWE